MRGIPISAGVLVVAALIALGSTCGSSSSLAPDLGVQPAPPSDTPPVVPADATPEIDSRESPGIDVAPRGDVGPETLSRCLACAQSPAAVNCRCDEKCVACSLGLARCTASSTPDLFALRNACNCLRNLCGDLCPVDCK